MSLARLAAAVLIAIIAGTFAVSPVLGARTPTKSQKVQIRIALAAESPDLTIALRKARVSTVDGRYAMAIVRATLPDGQPLESATGVLKKRPGKKTWRVLNFGTDLGGCSDLRRLGLPVRVIDDLQLGPASGCS